MSRRLPFAARNKRPAASMERLAYFWDEIDEYYCWGRQLTAGAFGWFRARP